MPRTTHCAHCPVAKNTKKTGCQPAIPSLFSDEETAQLLSHAHNHAEKGQEQALREAIAPYICLDVLRRLAARGDDIQAALRPCDQGDIPEDVQAFLRLLRVLLTPNSQQQILSPGNVAAMLMVEIGHLDHEEFLQICLDTKHGIQRIHSLYKGSLNSSTVRVGEIFRLPLLLNSASIIVAHNHPSGEPEPSPEDIQVTHSLVEAGKLLDVEVLDHLIIGQGRWLSLRERGLGW